MKLLFLALFFVAVSQPANAQNDPENPDEDEYFEDEIIDNGLVDKRKEKQKRFKKMGNPDPINLDGLLIGSNFSLNFASYFFNVDLSPYAGYRLGKFAAIGLGIPYVYSYSDNGAAAYHQHIYGVKSFLRFCPLAVVDHPIANAYLHAEGEYLVVAEKVQSAGSRYVHFNASAINIGAGYATPRLDKGFSFTAEVLLNVLYFSPSNIVTARPLVQYRVGVMYNFFQPVVSSKSN